MDRSQKIFVLIAALIVIGAAFILILNKFKAQEVNINQKGGGKMEITSTAFENNGYIPVKYTCQGLNTSPELSFSEVPPQTETLALILDDPDAPMGTFVHWVMWNIPEGTKGAAENGIPSGAEEGINGSGKRGYIGPCPPSGTHHYHFKLYALDTTLKLGPSTDKAGLEAAMQGHIIDQAVLTGLYSKGE